MSRDYEDDLVPGDLVRINPAYPPGIIGRHGLGIVVEVNADGSLSDECTILWSGPRPDARIDRSIKMRVMVAIR